MTMMTPMGQGGWMYPHRRRWTKVLAVLVVIAVVGAAIGFGAWKWLDGRSTEDTPTPRSTPSCTTPEPRLPKDIPPPRQVSLDVNNGTDENGLAVSTADDFTTLGFDVQGIGNTARPVEAGVASVRYTRENFGAAIRVASFVPGAKLVELKGKSTEMVDLWLGPDFAGVLPKDEADVANVELPKRKPDCR